MLSLVLDTVSRPVKFECSWSALIPATIQIELKQKSLFIPNGEISKINVAALWRFFERKTKEADGFLDVLL